MPDYDADYWRIQRRMLGEWMQRNVNPVSRPAFDSAADFNHRPRMSRPVQERLPGERPPVPQVYLDAFTED